ncbi:uncharacterized protein LOC116613511 [Nematostella vectensis]|uniref:uncharacterized protein LOC116613511 n=1 Tax=Nematostella vectensis TaxID=45351 RepID=UPI0013905F75|nr:uncharacterized protein LOC116613511 [Nematostella vectensis]
MAGENEMDIVFILGPKRCVQRSYNHLKADFAKVFHHARIATIRFTNRFESSLNRMAFFCQTSMFRSSDILVMEPRETCSSAVETQGNPIHRAALLDYREKAVKLCFYIGDMLPFIEDFSQERLTNNETLTNEQLNKIKANNKTSSDKDKSEMERKLEDLLEVDPLISCHMLAAKGVVLYAIEKDHATPIQRDTFNAMVYATGGQYLQVPRAASIPKVIKKCIVEELFLDIFVPHCRDFLCEQWYSWGRKRTRIPQTMDELTENVHNNLLTNGAIAKEVLHKGEVTEISKKIASLSTLILARKLTHNTTTDTEWLNIADEVIPGYVTEKKQAVSEVTLSGLKPISKNQASRLLVRALKRRTDAVQLRRESNQETGSCSPKLDLNNNGSNVSHVKVRDSFGEYHDIDPCSQVIIRGEDTDLKEKFGGINMLGINSKILAQVDDVPMNRCVCIIG